MLRQRPQLLLLGSLLALRSGESRGDSSSWEEWDPPWHPPAPKSPGGGSGRALLCRPPPFPRPPWGPPSWRPLPLGPRSPPSLLVLSTTPFTPQSLEGLLSLWGSASACHRLRPPACLLSPSPVPGVHQVQSQHLPGLRRVRAWLRLVPEAGKGLTERCPPPRGASRLACPPPFPPPGLDLLLCLWNCCLQECQHSAF